MEEGDMGEGFGGDERGNLGGCEREYGRDGRGNIGDMEERICDRWKRAYGRGGRGIWGYRKDGGMIMGDVCENRNIGRTDVSGDMGQVELGI
jgi:hypothetical protein